MEERSLYLMPNRDELARQRLDALGALFDPITQRGCSASACAPGGGAGRSAPVTRTWSDGWRLPSDQAGSVVATDIDPSGLESDHEPWVDICIGDVARDEPPEGPFDLVHARLVLTHVPERERAPGPWHRSSRPGACW